MGEYARSLAIAQGVTARWPEAAIHFVLSREAPYAGASPYPATLLDSSATFHSAAVIAIVQDWRPDVVIFDNAGRTAQLRAAARHGARVIYISARRRQRRKAFRLRWMRVIDEHWIAYPSFVAGGLGIIERLKLALMHRPRVRFLDVILARSAAGSDAFALAGAPAGARAGAPASILVRLGCAVDGYVLVVPGGGTDHPGARGAVQQFRSAARELAAAGIDTVFVGGGPAVAEPPAGARLRLAGSLPQGDLADLMRGARLIVTNGGSTLLQSIACGRPCIAVPIAGDQAARIRRCVGAGVALASPLDAAAISDRALGVLRDGQVAAGLAARARALGLEDGVDVALGALSALLA